LLLLATAILALPVTVIAQGIESTGLPTSPSAPTIRGDSLVLFVSDSQSPIFIEKVKLPSNNNERAREMIFSQMLAERPDGIFTLGDMVSIGLYHRTWVALDDFLDRARKARIPVFPILGNHEVMFYAPYGTAEFRWRFPWYQKTGYAVRAGKLAVTMLNSNFDQLSDLEQSRQLAWLDSTLAAFEGDSTVGVVIVACHHPPFTNSTIVSPSTEVRDSIVPLYLRYSKCKVFLSGHCHAFEHFRHEGKDFVVMGGGGGLQQPLLTGSDVKWEDLFPRKTEIRMFHYLRCRITGQGLEITVRMIREDFSDFEDAYALSFPFIQPTRN
jgi:3',5'-cyclic AMP phosphodiesterase CpdA